MSTPADTTPPAAPAGTQEPAAAVDEGLKLLFDAEEPSAPPAKQEEGMSLMQAISDDTPAEEPKKEEGEKKEGEKKEEAKAETPPPAETPPAKEETPIPARRRKIEPTPPPAPAPEPPTPPVPPKQDELEGIELMDEEKESLALAEYAEKTGDPKYTGLVDRVKKYIKAHAKFVDEERKADPDAVFDASNPRYQAFLAKNKPAMSQADARAIDRQRTADEATAKIKPELDRMHDETFKRDAEPLIRGNANKFISGVVNESAPAAMKEVLTKEGVAKAKEKFPFEFAVIEKVVGDAAADMEEFMRLTTSNPKTGSPLAKFNENNPQHTRIVGFVDELCDTFSKSGSKELLRDGKRFLTRRQYGGLKPEQRGAYWTFSNEEIVQRARGIANAVIKERLVADEKRLESMGFKRVSAPPPSSPPPTPSGSPAAPRSVTPPPASGPSDAEDAAVKKAKTLLYGED